MTDTVGYHHGSNVINLAQPDCVEYPVIMHELLHKIGLWHEHTRPDRDRYLVIHRENISPGKCFRRYYFNIVCFPFRGNTLPIFPESGIINNKNI